MTVTCLAPCTKPCQRTRTAGTRARLAASQTIEAQLECQRPEAARRPLLPCGLVLASDVVGCGDASLFGQCKFTDCCPSVPNLRCNWNHPDVSALSPRAGQAHSSRHFANSAGLSRSRPEERIVLVIGGLRYSCRTSGGQASNPSSSKRWTTKGDALPLECPSPPHGHAPTRRLLDGRA